MGIPLIQGVVLLYEPLQFSRVVVQNRLVYSTQGGGELLLLLRHRLHSKHKAGVTKGLGSASPETPLRWVIRRLGLLGSDTL